MAAALSFAVPCRRLAVLLTAARSIGCAMPDDKVLSCECGYEVTATDEAELVEEVRRHARDAHGIAFTVEEALLVLLRSELEPSRVSTESGVRGSRARNGGSS
jgi:predicted small metal-binding protein